MLCQRTPLPQSWRRRSSGTGNLYQFLVVNGHDRRSLRDGSSTLRMQKMPEENVRFSPRSLCVYEEEVGADVAGVAGVATGPSALLCAELMPTCHIQLCNAMYVYIRPRTAVLPGKGHFDCARAVFCACWYIGRMAIWLTRLVSKTQNLQS